MDFRAVCDAVLGAWNGNVATIITEIAERFDERATAAAVDALRRNTALAVLAIQGAGFSFVSLRFVIFVQLAIYDAPIVVGLGITRV